MMTEALTNGNAFCRQSAGREDTPVPPSRDTSLAAADSAESHERAALHDLPEMDWQPRPP